MDLTKAFDIIDRGILLKKLKYYGFGRNVIKWFVSFLTGRIGYVNNDRLASLNIPGVGVPQGFCSIYLYVNDFCSATSRCVLVQCADGTTILVKSWKSAVDFARKVECVTKEFLIGSGSTNYKLISRNLIS